MPESTDYASHVHRSTEEYRKAWEEAPQSFKDAAAKAGIGADVESAEGYALEFDEDQSSMSYTPDMRTLDTETDALIEELGPYQAKLVTSVAGRLRAAMSQEAERLTSEKLTRVVGLLVKCDRKNVLARVHQLLHAIPRLALTAGFASMRASARECGVSVEWIRRGRDQWCQLLDLEIPVEGVKSEVAKIKYRATATTNHWRHQKFKPIPTHHNKPTP